MAIPAEYSNWAFVVYCTGISLSNNPPQGVFGLTEPDVIDQAPHDHTIMLQLALSVHESH